MSNQLDLDHELIPWAVFEETFGVYYSETRGRPRKSIRLMVSLLRLQHTHDLSDEKIVKDWKENPCFQYFSGYDEIQWSLPVDSSSLVKFRKK